MNEQWMTMSEAANEMGVPVAQISRLAKKGEIKVQKDRLNKRVRLVDINEIKTLFKSSIYYSRNTENPK